MRLETTAVHGDVPLLAAAGPVATPIFETAAFTFESADHAAALFNLEAEGFRYSRISNPTTEALERRVALLERGVGAVATSSGQAALLYAILNCVAAGKNVVSSPQLYGTTHTLFTHLLPSMGIEVRVARGDGADDLAAAIDQDTRAIFCETIGNPAGNICDISAIAALSQYHGIPFIVDNTLATPMLLRPIEHGADIVVHSLTKFMGGHGAALGGAVIDGGHFPWSRYPDKFPMFSEPDQAYHGMMYSERFGEAAYISRCRSTFVRVAGATISPMTAFLLLLGIETLAVRMDRHVANAAKVAAFLRNDPRIDWVNFVGFGDNPYRELCLKYLEGRAPSVFTFGVKGGLAAAKRLYDRLRLVKRVVNFGDVRSLACHPASTTHRQMSAAQQRAAGITPDLIRLSVGIEQSDDIIADLAQALDGCDIHSCSATEAV